jgi:hypothetical protein
MSANRAAHRRRRERIAQRAEAAENMALAEAARRAHLAGEPWNPADPWRFYPSPSQRISEAVAAQDFQVGAELRVAKSEAARVLQSHGVSAEVLVDASQPQSPPPPTTSLGDAAPRRPEPWRRGSQHEPPH